MALRTSSLRTTMAVLAALTLSSALAPPTRAAESYTIPASDGYGIGECMQSGNDCGRVMADSWCEAHGHAHVLAYGTQADVTGAIAEQASATPVSVSASGTPGDIVIRCGD